MKLQIPSHLLWSGLALLVSGCSAFNAAFQKPVPPGAAALGCTKCVIDECPTVTDITASKNGAFKWFSGQWWQEPPTPDHYRMVDGVLALKPGGVLVSAPRDLAAPGRLPALPGDKGFYVEFEVRLSDKRSRPLASGLADALGAQRP